MFVAWGISGIFLLLLKVKIGERVYAHQFPVSPKLGQQFQDLFRRILAVAINTIAKICLTSQWT